VAIVEILSGCGCERLIDRNETASLGLTCAAAGHGVRCRLLAFSRDVSRSPRDVTGDASWRLSGAAGARMSRDGLLTVSQNGDVAIEAEYQSHHAHARARLTRNGPGQMLAALRGWVYVETGSVLKPVA
jgi:hypothetical protein